MHTDNLTSEEIKEFLVYSASHHGAWQIINNFKSILWYKHSQGPGTWPSTTCIPSFCNTPSSLEFKERTLWDHSWQSSSVQLHGEPSRCSSQKEHMLWRRVTEHPLFPWSADAASTFSLQGDRVIQSMKRCFPARSLRHTGCRSNSLPFPLKRSVEHKKPLPAEKRSAVEKMPKFISTLFPTSTIALSRL